MTMTHLKLNYSGWTDDHSGYGKANIHMIEAINRLTGGGVSMEWEREICASEDQMKNYTQEQKDILRKPFTLERIGIIQSTPNMFKNTHNDYRIGWSMVEDTHIGKKWVEYCNEMDEIFVPCKQLVPIFKKYKVTKPITVIPEGYDPKEHYYIDRPKRDVFTFLVVGWMDQRKNWEAMAQAFMSEFGPDEPVQFIIKNSCPHFGFRRPVDKRIKIVDHYLTPEELNRLYGLADCFVFTTRGEGFGIPPLEAMATGLPTILTNWLGSADLCDDRYNYFIEPADLEYRYFRPEQQGFMANLDVQEIMYWMRYIYEHQEEAKEKGRLASEWVKENWTWDHSAKKVIEVVEKALKSLPPSWKDNYEFSNSWLEDVAAKQSLPEFLNKFKDKKTKVLQIGAYEGRWTLWALHNILTHPDCIITDIDPWTTEEEYLKNKVLSPLNVVKERYFKNIDKCPYKNKVVSIDGKSEEELPKINDEFDLIYIDGSHLAKNVSVDAEESWRLCKSGGIILFDDYLWNMQDGYEPKNRPHEAINEFLVNHLGKYEVVHKEYQLAIRKL